MIDARVPSSQIASVRDAELRRMLAERRMELLCALQRTIRRVPGDGAPSDGGGVIDAIERSDADIQEEIGFSITQMKSEALHMIDDALRRLDEGTFGYCVACAGEISEQRLRALPFAARCHPCEHARERAARHEMSRRRAEPLLELT